MGLIRAILAITGCTIVLTILLGLVGGLQKEQAPSPRKEPAKMSKLSATHRKSDQGAPLGGFTTGPGFSIRWKGTDEPQGAEPIDAVAAAADRLQHLQQTTAGGNETAKALWEVQSCLQKLEAIYQHQPKAPLGNGSGAGFGGTQETKDQ